MEFRIVLLSSRQYIARLTVIAQTVVPAAQLQQSNLLLPRAKQQAPLLELLFRLLLLT